MLRSNKSLPEDTWPSPCYAANHWLALLWLNPYCLQIERLWVELYTTIYQIAFLRAFSLIQSAIGFGILFYYVFNISFHPKTRLLVEHEAQLESDSSLVQLTMR